MQQPASEIIPEPQKEKAPVVALNKTTTLKLPTLNKTVKVAEETAVKENDLPTADSQKQKDFSFDDLKSLWKQYADKVKSENRNSEYTILNRNIELTEDYTIKIRLENVILLDQLNAFKSDLLDFLRKNLGNNKIMLETSITEQQEVKKIYTAQDKLNFLLEKYPVVAEMKKRLGLDTDY